MGSNVHKIFFVSASFSRKIDSLIKGGDFIEGLLFSEHEPGEDGGRISAFMIGGDTLAFSMKGFSLNDCRRILAPFGIPVKRITKYIFMPSSYSKVNNSMSLSWNF